MRDRFKCQRAPTNFLEVRYGPEAGVYEVREDGTVHGPLTGELDQIADRFGVYDSTAFGRVAAMSHAQAAARFATVVARSQEIQTAGEAAEIEYSQRFVDPE